jgi:2,5-furandicarboxylate decarboxylase 1
MILKDQPGHILNPMVEGGLVTKVGVDATVPFPRTSAFERVKFKDVDLKKHVIE